MLISIDHKPAVLKQGTSFEYVAENRMFSGSDAYTFQISFPLKGCPQNQEIFGNICRADIAARKAIFDCEIRNQRFSKFGTITITEISETEVKAQFLEGRSEQNYNTTFDDIYINELTLGDATGADDSTPMAAWNPAISGHKCVALPWVNDASGNIQNLAEFTGNDTDKFSYAWHEDCKQRSWQPYLLYIAKEICRAVGYSFDFSPWEEKEEYRYILICNTLPAAWDINDFARALPQWTVAEFFEKLELFLDGQFNIDYRARHISFEFNIDVISSTQPVELKDIVDEHTVEVTIDDPRCEYQEMKNLVYKECNNEMWKFYSCDWFIKSWKDRAVRFETLDELLSDSNLRDALQGIGGRDNNMNKLLYAADVDTYFLVRTVYKTLIQKRPAPQPNSYKYTYELRPINMFGGRIVDTTEGAQANEIEFVPAWIDDTEKKYGRCLFLSFAGYDEATSSESSVMTDEELKDMLDSLLPQPIACLSLEAGDATKKSEYYDRIYVAWWDGATDLLERGKLPHPHVEDIEIASDLSQYRRIHFSFSLNRNLKQRRQVLHAVDVTSKSTFRFISDTIPNPRAVFFIRGKRYLCEKITATFDENGMSHLLKGEFYPII